MEDRLNDIKERIKQIGIKNYLFKKELEDYDKELSKIFVGKEATIIDTVWEHPNTWSGTNYKEYKCRINQVMCSDNGIIYFGIKIYRPRLKKFCYYGFGVEIDILNIHEDTKKIK